MVQNGARVLSPTRSPIFYFGDCLPAGRLGTRRVVKKSGSYISVSYFLLLLTSHFNTLIVSEIMRLCRCRFPLPVSVYLELNYDTSWCRVGASSQSGVDWIECRSWHLICSLQCVFGICLVGNLKKGSRCLISNLSKRIIYNPVALTQRCEINSFIAYTKQIEVLRFSAGML